ncbi:hypothetical protein ACHAXT_009638 [Thalassiosira profunda]
MPQWVLFLPAICLYTLWITIGLRDGIIAASVSSYYPLMIAMVFGSMIAGATPLGGGVVGFPVAVLIIGFSPAEGRDFSLLIQSIGMTAASFLILYNKRRVLGGYEDFVSKCIVASLVGLIIGFELLDGIMSPFLVNLVYTTAVACISLVFAYQEFYGRWKAMHNVDPLPSSISDGSGLTLSGSSDDSRTDAVKRRRCKNEKAASILLEHICFPLLSAAGGVLTSQIGSGADIMCFVSGSIMSALTARRQRRGPDDGSCSDNTLTAASVIVMASVSVFGSVLRLTARQGAAVETDVLLAVFACSPIVVLGAPVGSLFLIPSNKRRLKCAFCVLGMVQLAIFGVIKIGNNGLAWAVVLSILFIVVCALVAHYVVSSRVYSKSVEADASSI